MSTVKRRPGSETWNKRWQPPPRSVKTRYLTPRFCTLLSQVHFLRRSTLDSYFHHGFPLKKGDVRVECPSAFANSSTKAASRFGFRPISEPWEDTWCVRTLHCHSHELICVLAGVNVLLGPRRNTNGARTDYFLSTEMREVSIILYQISSDVDIT